jgi:hypothetical protein
LAWTSVVRVNPSACNLLINQATPVLIQFLDSQLVVMKTIYYSMTFILAT